MENLKRLPDKLKKLQLGQVYNASSNVFANRNYLDLQKLQDKDLLNIANLRVTEMFKFSHENNSDSGTSALNVAGGIKGSGWGMTVSAAFNHYNEKAESSNKNTIKAEVYKIKTAFIELCNDYDEKGVIFSCLRESGFKDDWAAIRLETEAKKRLKIEQFKQKYGTGMVVRVDLMAGAMSKLEFRSQSDNKRSTSVNEAGFDITSRVVSAKGDLKISDDLSKFNLSVTQVGETECFPTEIEAYKKYVDNQLEYLKNYIEKKNVEARKPEFSGANDIKVKLADLKVKERTEDEKDAEQKKELTAKLEAIKVLLLDITQKSIVNISNQIITLETNSPRISLDPYFLSVFNKIKEEFKSGLLEYLVEAEGQPKDDNLKDALPRIILLTIRREEKKKNLFSTAEAELITTKIKG